ncbi:MAG TPA: DUF6152 family protein [Gammaproteobacteria bacterium]
MKTSTTLLTLLWVPIAALGHHSVTALYDDTVVELEGEVTSVLWRNPHVGFSMNVRDENGEIQEWDMAMTALSNLRRWQIPRDFLVVGEAIRVAGRPSRRGDRAMYISNALRPNGEEILLLADAVPRWSDRTVEMSESRRAGVGDPSEPERGIYRVWSRPPGVSNPFFQMDELGRHLTDSARAAVAAYVQQTDIPIRDCTPKGMPTIMEAPYPWEFIRRGNDLILHQEEYDTRRTIHMAAEASSDGETESLLGYSVGGWEGDTLVVTTTNSNWRHLNTRGIPLSADAVSVERFTMRPDGSRMDWEMTVTDPATFVEPVTLRQHWVWYPDAVVDSYDCLIAAEDQ